jgi:hypothetical protein
VAKGPKYQTASLQVNGADVATGNFRAGAAPVLGYSPTSPAEIVIYRAIADGKTLALGTYKLLTDGHSLHPLEWTADDSQLKGHVNTDGEFLIFGPDGLIGSAKHGSFSIDLSRFSSGPAVFRSVFVNGKYAEAPQSITTSIRPSIGFENWPDSSPRSKPLSFRVTDPRRLGIASVSVSLNGKKVGEFEDLSSNVLVDLSNLSIGSYRLSVLGKLADGSTIGPETRMVEVVDGTGSAQSAQSAPPGPFAVLISAWYCVPDGRRSDAKEKVRGMLAAGRTTFEISNNVFSDPAPAVHKQLIVTMNIDGTVQTFTGEEGVDMVLPSAALNIAHDKSAVSRIVSATYGGIDITQVVKAMVGAGQLYIRADSATLTGRDPQPNVRKTLTVTIKDDDGSQRTLSASEGGGVWLTPEPKLLNQVTNGSFDQDDASPFVSAMKYVQAGEGVLGEQGVFTLAYGTMRPVQLHNSLRLDFIQHSSSPNSGAMFINPIPGRQPILLWAEKVKVQPNTNYEFKCFCSDISESDRAWASIVLQVDDQEMRPVVLTSADDWEKIWFNMRTGDKPYAIIRIWRDVLPPWADTGAIIALDDITFVPRG